MKTLLFLVSMIVISCNGNRNDAGKDKHTAVSLSAGSELEYDFKHPDHTWFMPDELKEISGIARIDRVHFIVIEDLHPRLYFLTLDSSDLIHSTFDFMPAGNEKFDIEDVTLKNDTVYALWSHGAIFRITDWRKEGKVQEFRTSLSKKNNTEGICYDPTTNSLLIACKEDAGVSDEKMSTRAVYAFDLATATLTPKPFMFIRKSDFRSVADEKIDFYPSAIAVHPLKKDIYLLSTRGNKCLAVYDHEGHFRSFTFLDPGLMPQPEGICFAPDGTLYITSQGRHGKPGVIYEFRPVR